MNVNRYASFRLTENEETTQEGADEAPSSVSGEEDAPAAQPAAEAAPTEPEVPRPELAPPAAVAIETLLLEETFESPIEMTGSVWRVVVIREGMSANGRWYTADALRQSIPLWEGEDVCAYGYDPSGKRDANHIPLSVERQFPYGTFLNKVGLLRNVTDRVREGRVELVADLHVIDDLFREKVMKGVRAGGKPPGLSIHAYGKGAVEMREGRQVQVVTQLTGTRELTVVSKPAAGGAFERLVAALDPTPEKENDTMKWEKLRTFLAGIFPPASKRMVEAMEEKMLLESAAQALLEMDAGLAAFIETALEFLSEGLTDQAGRLLEKALAQFKGAAPEPVPTEEATPEPMPNVYESKENEQAQAILAEAQRVQAETQAMFNKMSTEAAVAVLERRLKEANLPDVASEKLRAQFANGTFTESALDAEIKYAKDMMAVNGGGMALIEGQHNTGSGMNSGIQILRESVDKIQIGADLLFGYPWQKDASLTESDKEVYKQLSRNPRNFAPSTLYHAATGDWNHTNQLQNGCALLEAATTASFPNILGTSMNRTLHWLMAAETAPLWEPFIKQVDHLNLKQHDRIIAGGFTILPSVAQGAAYQDLGVPLELPMNYTLGKTGGVVIFTEECVFNDDLDYFATLIPAMKRAAIATRDRLAWNLVLGKAGGGAINTDTSYDGFTHYHAAHDNLGGSALAHASLVTGMQSIMRTRTIAFRTTISTDHTNSVTTLTATSTSGFQVGNYARINSEIVLITAIGSGTSATIVRAQLGTSAAAHTSGDAVIILGDSLSLSALDLHLIVPIGLVNTANELVNSELVPGTNNNNKNMLRGMMKVVPVDEALLGGDMNNWYLTTTWANVPGLEIGYFNGQRIPDIIVQDQPAVGAVFTNDQITYKVKYRIGGKAIMHEGRYAGIS